MSQPIPLAYTFGNHMHWVDMQWLWGYDVLPGSTDDMLAYCQKAGVKGNVNFDGIGYEKMAAECPEQLAALREAIKQGIIEVVGASYGQPYGLFHGGESNVRQRIYGVRTAIRVLGTRPRTFWEEEFDFYPQLPQMLAGCGYTGASLYFQWTWHAPEVPFEDVPVVAWQGIDGTQIPTATRNRLNLHQWPEDFRILLDDLAADPPTTDDIPPLVLQWLELMPTQDWMCRSELMLPMLAELKADPRFRVEALTLGEYLAKWTGRDLPVRPYKLDDVWHGMTLGKNGDNHPSQSAEWEQIIRQEESAAAILSLFGRPYDPWDVYPTWELEELWRTLLAYQHHDNHECEGLCGHVAEFEASKIGYLAARNSSTERLAKRVLRDRDDQMLFNSNSFEAIVNHRVAPSFGYRVVPERLREDQKWKLEGSIATFEFAEMRVRFDTDTLTILELTNANGTIENLQLAFAFGFEGNTIIASTKAKRPNAVHVDGGKLELLTGEFDVANLKITAGIETGELNIGFTIETEMGYKQAIDPGYGGAVRVLFPLGQNAVIRSDSPFAVHEVGTGSSGKRKYPEGDWMTSKQWFESVEGAFTAQSFVDIAYPQGSNLLITHCGSQQWFRCEDHIENVVMSLDPWDGKKQKWSGGGGYRLYVHDGLSNADCVRQSRQNHRANYASTWLSHQERELPEAGQPEMPDDFSAVTIHTPGVLATAFYREQESFCKRGLNSYGGEGMGHPFILRLVEYDGVECTAEVTLPGPIAKAYKTNLLGEIEEEVSFGCDHADILTSEPQKLAPFGIKAVRLNAKMKPHEIATFYLDIIPGRKQFRDLDANREVWATIHRTTDS
ncbi:MAG: hypothetical protein JST12_16700 [Armatimonadetes bacterium]|nr:hypothetical protein [Armatimonadota bacterium]